MHHLHMYGLHTYANYAYMLMFMPECYWLVQEHLSILTVARPRFTNHHMYSE